MSAEEKLRMASVMSVPEAGELLGLGRASAYKAAKGGHIPTLSIGTKVLVPTAPLREMLGIASSDESNHTEKLTDQLERAERDARVWKERYLDLLESVEDLTRRARA